jgi:hypothetical protein
VPGKSTLVQQRQESPAAARSAQAHASAVVARPEEAMDRATRGGGAVLPFRAEMEGAFRQDLGNVRAYPGQAAAMQAVGADAVARGESIAFPASSPDRELVAHEVAHVVQARQAGGGRAPRSGLSRSSDDAEVEADAAARAVVEGRRPEIQAAPDAALHAAFARIGDGHDTIPPGTKVEFDEDKYPVVEGALPYDAMEVTHEGKPFTIDGRTLVLDEAEAPADPPGREPEAQEPDPEDPFYKHIQAAARHLVEATFRGTGTTNVAPVGPWQVGTAQPLDNALHLPDVVNNDPAEALDALIAHIDEVLVDCAEFVDLVRLRAIQTQIGPAKFNRWIRYAAQKQSGQLRGKLVVRGQRTTGLLRDAIAFSRQTASEPLFSTVRPQVPASDVPALLLDLPIGARVAWRDSNPDAVGSDFENENTIKVGRDQYANAGLPVRVASARETELLLAGVGSGSDEPSVQAVYAKKWIFVCEIDVMTPP